MYGCAPLYVDLTPIHLDTLAQTTFKELKLFLKTHTSLVNFAAVSFLFVSA